MEVTRLVSFARRSCAGWLGGGIAAAIAATPPPAGLEVQHALGASSYALPHWGFYGEPEQRAVVGAGQVGVRYRAPGGATVHADLLWGPALLDPGDVHDALPWAGSMRVRGGWHGARGGLEGGVVLLGGPMLDVPMLLPSARAWYGAPGKVYGFAGLLHGVPTGSRVGALGVGLGRAGERAEVEVEVSPLATASVRGAARLSPRLWLGAEAGLALPAWSLGAEHLAQLQLSWRPPSDKLAANALP